MRIPVIRGQMGDWRYYTGVMKFEEVAKIVTPSVNEFCNPSCLKDLLQRQLTENYRSIVEYLLTEEQRFFNAIVLAIYDGDPQWLEVEFGEDYEEYNNVGFLEMSEERVRIFPVDGQHRVKGIIEALKCDSGLGTEEVSVIFLAHKNDIKGKRRTRKLFSTLNRRAKPVGDNYQIALDEDDIVAIVTREIVESFSLFQEERLHNGKTKQIPASNVQAFTSLISLYQCNESIIKNRLGINDSQLKKYKLYRPDDSEIEAMIASVTTYWAAFINKISVVERYLKSDFQPAKAFRNKEGGNLLFRPIGLIEFVKASIIISNRNHISFDSALEKMNTIQLDISADVWKGVVWDGKKIINRVNLNLIRLIILKLVAEDLLITEEREKLKELYAVATNYDGDPEELFNKIRN